MAQMGSLHSFTIAAIYVYGPINAHCVPVSHPSAMYDSDPVGCELRWAAQLETSSQKLEDPCANAETWGKMEGRIELSRLSLSKRTVLITPYFRGTAVTRLCGPGFSSADLSVDLSGAADISPRSKTDFGVFFFKRCTIWQAERFSLITHTWGEKPSLPSGVCEVTDST